MTKAPRKIIIDTDPGQDDAFAILLALASPEDLEVLAVTVVAGNAPLIWTERNARIICELAGRADMPVYAGCEAPLQRKLVTAEHVHGKTGLDGPVMEEPAMPLQTRHAVDYLIETLRAEPAGSASIPLRLRSPCSARRRRRTKASHARRKASSRPPWG